MNPTCQKSHIWPTTLFVLQTNKLCILVNTYVLDRKLSCGFWTQHYVWALYQYTSIKGGAHTHFIDAWISDVLWSIYEQWKLAIQLAIQCFKLSGAFIKFNSIQSSYISVLEGGILSGHITFNLKGSSTPTILGLPYAPG